MSPLVSSMLYAARRASIVDVSASGEFEPSLGLKIGSWPSVASKRALSRAGVTVMLLWGSWQVLHRRPLTPRSRKKGLSTASTGKPATLIVRATPDPLWTVKTPPCAAPSPRAEREEDAAPI